MKPGPESPQALADRIEVTAVMPCLNEENSLGICIEKAQRCFRDLGIRGEVVVADNGSTDRSVEIAEGLGARVVREQRKGYGAALTAGILAARGEIIVMADSDDSYDWLSIGDFVARIREGCDVVIGNRFTGGIEPGAMPALHRYVGNPMLSLITRVFYGIPIGDFHCGMRAFTRDAFRRMKVRAQGMEFATEMVVYSAQAGLRVGEIPTRLFPDKRNRAPHLRSFRDGWRHLRFIFTYAPDYLYLLPGSMLFGLGLLGLISLSSGPIQIKSVWFGIHFLALSSLFCLAGTNLIIFGVLAKTYHAAYHPQPRSLFSKFIEHFTLERGIIAGAGIAAIGLTGDLMILGEWLMRGRGAMQHTIHQAFVWTTAIATGTEIVFASFLLNMMRNRP